MLLSITSKHSSAMIFGDLLHKHPGRFQSYDLSFGQRSCLLHRSRS